MEDSKFRSAEDVLSVGTPGEPGYTILIVRRSPFSMLHKRHTYTLRIVHFSGRVEQEVTHSVRQVRQRIRNVAGGSAIKRTTYDTGV